MKTWPNEHLNLTKTKLAAKAADQRSINVSKLWRSWKWWNTCSVAQILLLPTLGNKFPEFQVHPVISRCRWYHNRKIYHYYVTYQFEKTSHKVIAADYLTQSKHVRTAFPGQLAIRQIVYYYIYLTSYHNSITVSTSAVYRPHMKPCKPVFIYISICSQCW